MTSNPVSGWLCSGCGWLNRGNNNIHPGPHILQREGGPVYEVIDLNTGATVFQGVGMFGKTDCEIWLSSHDPSHHLIQPTYCEGEWLPAFVITGTAAPVWVDIPITNDDMDIRHGWFLEELPRGGLPEAEEG